MTSADHEVLQEMERLTISQTTDIALNMASLQINDLTESTGRISGSISNTPAQALCTQSSRIQPSSSAMTLTRDMANATSRRRSPVNPHNVTKISIRHHKVLMDSKARFDDKKSYLEYCLHKRETLIHLAAPKSTSRIKSRAAADGHVRHRYLTLTGQAVRIDLAKRAVTRARLEYGEALRKLRRATKTWVAREYLITNEVGGAPNLMQEEMVLGGISEDLVMDD